MIGMGNIYKWETAMRRKGFVTGSVCLLAAFIVLSANICLASVTGTVTDTAGSPVSGALVTFTDESNPENKYSSYIDNESKYTITLSPASTGSTLCSINAIDTTIDQLMIIRQISFSQSFWFS